jgi:hypothetical protein
MLRNNCSLRRTSRASKFFSYSRTIITSAATHIKEKFYNDAILTRRTGPTLIITSQVADIIKIILPYINQVVIIVCNIYNQPYYKGCYSLEVVYRSLPQHHHNLMDEVFRKLSAEVTHVSALALEWAHQSRYTFGLPLPSGKINTHQSVLPLPPTSFLTDAHNLYLFRLRNPTKVYNTQNCYFDRNDKKFWTDVKKTVTFWSSQKYY